MGDSIDPRVIGWMVMVCMRKTAAAPCRGRRSFCTLFHEGHTCPVVRRIAELLVSPDSVIRAFRNGKSKEVFMKKKFTNLERRMLSLSCAVPLLAVMAVAANAMHIMEGFLPQGHAIAWGAVCVPFVVWGLISMKKIIAEHRKTVLLLAMMGAYAFVLSALKMPSVTGSSSHPTGTGLGAVLFGPAPMAVIGLIVLLFQAILLAHGGLTTLGANTFSMGIVGPFVSFGIYKLCRKLKIHRFVAVGLGCALGDLVTYCVTAAQLALAHPGQEGVLASMAEFLGIFALTQVPLAIVEGILSAIVIIMLESFAKPELREIGFLTKEAAKG